MGCPAREVTGKLSGSALMRDLEHAAEPDRGRGRRRRVPVTLKMRTRLGRGEPQRARNSRAAPRPPACSSSPSTPAPAASSSRACPTGPSCAASRRLCGIPVVVNGDIVDPQSAKAALDASGADAVMVGRGAYGAPWMPARIATYLASGRDPGTAAPCGAGRDRRRARRGHARAPRARSSACATPASTSAGIWRPAARSRGDREGLAPAPVHQRGRRARCSRASKSFYAEAEELAA